ncbi:MAG: PTS fructose transporter subunit IIA [Leuconostoc mesenteroides]|mgnify:FL=1|jgi:PTS system N-acetylgalactosamine-specific IIA component|uniref:PTS sugar transporter subunit IIA n=1 Tax=Leuconostoc mesenteroides TaxID=1245 RepID=UPI0003D93C12|nr:PTS fructose transporter subunit IIA [Leuconostoc mesenteroides]MBC9703245.1 PTS fructose transporter subunit IIA [Leuconostoc sp.]AHF19271.1 Phosphotransferase system, mannose/fructose-specific component IIA [Leuconostoc mesenteroides KFRI-MG]ASR67873.1 PTS fructose transporter subunit IIA [Leuconostoc mesenteroides]AWV38026.1 PTS fructose transporter subunit IIA [Leuconostoc mesenteroides]KAA8346800.1 PTS fructose transporter subunit IIA [Leuconostoc mesenteroides]
MNYLILVSHGQFSEGLKDALGMFVGDGIKTVKAIGLQSGEDTDHFENRFKSLLSTLEQNSELLILGDIIGGSPLTTVVNVLNQENRLESTIVLGGMNFPMALNAAILKDSSSKNELISNVLREGASALKQFEINDDPEDDDEI